ncbi:hypothetical protein [Thalassoroseus pseudoceratinae]|uniref:hypothetical protein n=1 Tax=Thalassoroseus pseudoceratinae TaxID=2713176 RepID=UPI0014224697|nr:hypothetical protein [Thalassoroseus pseudoceratinae]
MHNGTEAPAADRTSQTEAPATSQQQSSIEQLTELCRQHPMTSLMVGLGVGLGAGLLVGGAIGGGMKSRTDRSYLDKINRRVSDALADAIPDSWR